MRDCWLGIRYLVAVLVVGVALPFLGLASAGVERADEDWFDWLSGLDVSSVEGTYLVLVNANNRLPWYPSELAAIDHIRTLYLKDAPVPPPAAKSLPLARPEGHFAQNALRRLMLGMTAPELSRHWRDMEQAGGGTIPQVFETAEALVRAIARNKGAIGVIREDEIERLPVKVRVLFRFSAGETPEGEAISIESLLWRLGRDGGRPEWLRAYLTKFPSGVYAAAARARLVAEGAGDEGGGLQTIEADTAVGVGDEPAATRAKSRDPSLFRDIASDPALRATIIDFYNRRKGAGSNVQRQKSEITAIEDVSLLGVSDDIIDLEVAYWWRRDQGYLTSKRDNARVTVRRDGDSYEVLGFRSASLDLIAAGERESPVTVPSLEQAVIDFYNGMRPKLRYQTFGAEGPPWSEISGVDDLEILERSAGMVTARVRYRWHAASMPEIGKTETAIATLRRSDRGYEVIAFKSKSLDFVATDAAQSPAEVPTLEQIVIDFYNGMKQRGRLKGVRTWLEISVIDRLDVLETSNEAVTVQASYRWHDAMFPNVGQYETAIVTLEGTASTLRVVKYRSPSLDFDASDEKALVAETATLEQVVIDFYNGIRPSLAFRFGGASDHSLWRSISKVDRVDVIDETEALLTLQVRYRWHAANVPYVGRTEVALVTLDKTGSTYDVVEFHSDSLKFTAEHGEAGVKGSVRAGLKAPLISSVSSLPPPDAFTAGESLTGNEGLADAIEGFFNKLNSFATRVPQWQAYQSERKTMVAIEEIEVAGVSGASVDLAVTYRWDGDFQISVLDHGVARLVYADPEYRIVAFAANEVDFGGTDYVAGRAASASATVPSRPIISLPFPDVLTGGDDLTRNGNLKREITKFFNSFGGASTHVPNSSRRFPGKKFMESIDKIVVNRISGNVLKIDVTYRWAGNFLIGTRDHGVATLVHDGATYTIVDFE